MKVINTHGVIFQNTRLQKFARRREYADGRTVIQTYECGAWVDVCPGNEASFSPRQFLIYAENQTPTPPPRMAATEAATQNNATHGKADERQTSVC